MSSAFSPRPIDLTSLPWPVSALGNDTDGYHIEAPNAPDSRTLQAAVDGAPDVPEPVDRLAALEAEVRGMRDRVAAVEATGDAAKLRDAVRGPDDR